ncbi:uncharacterized protein PAE49_016939 [Odontesthes bonariensis]|uniref:uncharacterized protein LOC142390785 n=1 Tax=Odontesthes bonariensis TaxID=219752 RepID=UPI003F5823FE
MVRNKYLHRLKQHAHETGAVLKFEEISKDPEENRFIMRAVLGGRGFPNGVGSSAKKAKQNAAKEALRSINDKENQETKRENAAKNPAAPLCQNSRTTATFDQQSSVVSSAPCPSFVIFDEEDMTTPGKNKKKVRRKLKYNQKIREVSSESAVSEDGLARLSLPQNTQSFCRAKSKTVAKIGSSNRPNVQDTASSEGINPSEMPSVQSQTLWCGDFKT